MAINYKQLGRKIRKFRLEKGLTQEKLAEYCEVSASYISHIENGHKRVSLSTLDWKNVQKRLKEIISPELKLVFNSSTVEKHTFRKCASLEINHFEVKLDGKVIWEAQKDCAFYNEKIFWDFDLYPKWDFVSNGNKNEVHTFKASPQNIIAEYLDTPKSELLNFDEPTGLKFLLWASDKRIGKSRLKEMEFTRFALPIVKQRIPNYNKEPIVYQPCPIIYTCKDYTVFDLTKVLSYKWDEDKWYTTYVVANSIDYTQATHAVDFHYESRAKGGYCKVASKNKLILTDEQIALIKEKVEEYKNNL